MKYAVIGGGIGGLAGANYLAEKSHEVYLWESTEKVGGVATTISVPGGRLEGTYHHIFSSDKPILDLIQKINLTDHLVWHVSPMGFFSNNSIYHFGTGLDLLRYKPLKFIDRVRFGISALYFQMISDWRPLEKMTVKAWVQEKCSPELYEEIWKPLLSLKFGSDEAENVSAAWLWGRIHPRAKSRKKGKEHLGYLKHSFQSLFDGLADSIENMGGKIFTQSPIVQIKKDGNHYKVYTENGEENGFDGVLCTTPSRKICEVFPDMPEQFFESTNSFKYLGCICLILAHKKPLSNIYWLNISDPKIKFGGIIEHTNYIKPENYDNNHLTYIFNYLPYDHPYFQLTAEELLDEYMPSCQKIFPGLKPDFFHFSRKFQVRFATPLYTGAYSERKPPYQTPWPGVYIANMTQIYPEDRNMSNSAFNAQKAAEEMLGA